MNNTQLLDALRDCYTQNRNIVDANLVRSASLTADATAPGASIPGIASRSIAHVILRAPSTDDASNAQLVAQIENRLLGLQAISRVEVTLLPPLFPIL